MAGYNFLFFCVLSMGLLLASSAQALSPQEEERVAGLLTALEKRTDMAFIRNGVTSSVSDAVAHLKLKLGNTRDYLGTAEEFIDKAASSSSLSGKPYMVQQPGKPSEPANKFLHELLKQISVGHLKGRPRESVRQIK